MMAGEGIPAFFWAQSAQPHEELIEVGARNLLDKEENFSYRNVHVAEIDGAVAGMMLAYRLPDEDGSEDLDSLPEFIRPLVELEQCVSGSFYINMLATFPEYRNQGVGSTLMGQVDRLAIKANCHKSSIEVFDQNVAALRLYQRLGYSIIDRRQVIPHPCHPYDGDIILLTRPVS